MSAHICRHLKLNGIQSVEYIREQDLQTCYRSFQKKFPNKAGSVCVLARFLIERGFVQSFVVHVPSSVDIHVSAFMNHLRDARGYIQKTIQQQGCIAEEFLKWLKYEDTPHRLESLSIEDIESFVQQLSKRMGRAGLQNSISMIRNFLRFLAADGAIAPGLDRQIDRPRVYRQEKLPRALPWTTVQKMLQSIDRKTAIGKRDYAIFSLMATYGMRACDVVALTLDDIQWRTGRIRICQSKTGNPLELPLTHEVSSAIYDYLKKVPRYGNYRQIFLRLKAPRGILKSTAVTEAFQAWSKRSGLDIPFKGAHCLRHSFALHLLRNGLPLKTIGDILGHRSPGSIASYIRLSVDDLREVALHVPGVIERQKEGQLWT